MPDLHDTELSRALAPHGNGSVAEAAVVREFWGQLGLPGLVDIHTHFMPANVLAKVWAYFEEGRGPAGHAWPIVYRQPEQERVALLRAYGVRRFSALHSATFFPEPDAGGYVAEAIAGGARLFKAHLQVGGYDPRDKLLDPVWGLLADTGVPVIVHCGSGPTPGRYTGPRPMSEVLARHPRLTTIIAHLGAPEYGAFLGLAERHAGVYLDTTMAFTDFLERLAPFPAALLPRLAAAADRILLGSDFPNIPYSYAHQLQALARLEFGAPWLRAVCHDNSARLLGL